MALNTAESKKLESAYGSLSQELMQKTELIHRVDRQNMECIHTASETHMHLNDGKFMIEDFRIMLRIRRLKIYFRHSKSYFRFLMITRNHILVKQFSEFFDVYDVVFSIIQEKEINMNTLAEQIKGIGKILKFLKMVGFYCEQYKYTI